MPFDRIGWWIIIGGIWMIVFWGGLIALIVWAVTRLSRRGGNLAGRDALEIARERYAKGEINREQFDQIKRDLQG